MRTFLAPFLLLALLGGCAPGQFSGPGVGSSSGSVGDYIPPAPRTVPEARYAAAQALLGAREALIAAEDSGLVPPGSASDLHRRLDRVREGIERAGALWKGGSEVPASIELDAAMSLLKVIKEEIAKYGNKQRSKTDAVGEGSGDGAVSQHSVACSGTTRAGDCAGDA